MLIPRLLNPVLVTFTVLGLTGCLPRTEPISWPTVNRAIRNEFPNVEQLSTQQLSDWLSTSAPPPLLLDIRQPEEYAVSHLQHAQRATTLEEALGQLEDTDPNQKIVVYCSVGYRSSALAEQLIEAGYPNVYNLEGSLFAWANEDRPLYQGAEQVQQVHPYNQNWGQLLERSRRAPLPN